MVTKSKKAHSAHESYQTLSAKKVFGLLAICCVLVLAFVFVPRNPGNLSSQAIVVPPSTECVNGQVSLEWDGNPETNIIGYELGYSTQSNQYSTIIRVDTTNYGPLHLNATREGITYYFSVRAVNTAGLVSPWSSEVSFTAYCDDDGEVTLTPPTNTPYTKATYNKCDYSIKQCTTVDGRLSSTCTIGNNTPCLCEPPKVMGDKTVYTIEKSTDLQSWTVHAGPDVGPNYDIDAAINAIRNGPNPPPSIYMREKQETTQECIDPPSNNGSSFFGGNTVSSGPSLWSRLMTYISSLFSSQSLTSNAISTTPPSQPGSYKNVDVFIKNLGEGNKVIMSGDVGSITIQNSSPFKASFPQGTKLSFTAIIGPNSTFNGWTGGCTTIVGRTCSFTVKEGTVITAAFDYKQVLLSTNMSRTGTGMGTVISSYRDIECGAGNLKCAKGYPYNTFETLTAVPNDGYKFTSWSGACVSYGTTCNLMMNGDKTVYAGFVPVNTTINAVGMYGSMEIAPNIDYVFVYEGQGTEMSVLINGENILQTWIVQSDLAMISNNGWTCNSSNTVCSGPNEAYITFENFDSNTLSVEVKYHPGLDSVPPTAPETIEPVDLQQTSAEITWSASQDNESIGMYMLYVDGEYVGFELDTQERTETLWNLEPNTTYEVGVKALDNGGNESTIKTASVRTAESIVQIDGVCSTTIDTCTAGTFADITDTTTQYKWSCTGLNGGTTSACVKNKPPVNGVCSTTIDTCTAGTFTDITDTTTQYKWSCTGLNGGTTSACVKNKPPVNGVCSTTINTCTAGTFVDIKDTGIQYKWSCTGLNGGTTSSCIKRKR